MININVRGVNESMSLLTNIMGNIKTEGTQLPRKVAAKLRNEARRNISANRKWTVGPSDVANTIKSYKVGPTSYAVEVFHPAAVAIEEGRDEIQFDKKQVIYMRGIGFRTFGPGISSISSTKPKWFMRNAINKVTKEMDKDLKESSDKILKR